jgi:hypothetical protein
MAGPLKAFVSPMNGAVTATRRVRLGGRSQADGPLMSGRSGGVAVGASQGLVDGRCRVADGVGQQVAVDLDGGGQRRVAQRLETTAGGTRGLIMMAAAVCRR